MFVCFGEAHVDVNEIRFDNNGVALTTQVAIGDFGCSLVIPNEEVSFDELEACPPWALL